MGRRPSRRRRWPPPGRQERAQRQGLLLDRGRALVGDDVGRLGLIAQADGAVGLVPGPPLADRLAGRGEGAGRRADPVLVSVLHQFDPERVRTS